jgi:predicted component of type VI protein secretion system
MSRRFTIGRDKNCDVPIFDDSVSRLHAEIWLADDGSLMMTDRGSANGTTVVRGKTKFPLNQDVILPGDYIRMGSVMLSAGEIVEAVEAKQPGALTHTALPPSPPVAAAAPPPPPHFAGPPHGYAAGAGPVPPPPRPPGGVLVRCECGAIKTAGQICPGCHR